MKKIVLTLGSLVLMSMLVLPAMARQKAGYGMGPEMMESGYGYGVRQRPAVDEETLKAYQEEVEKHYQSTESQRQDVLVKQHEIATMLIDSKSTKEALLEKQKELQNLMNALQSDELSFRWDMNNKYPDMTQDIYRGCLGPATGGIGMMGYGYYGHHGMMGYGCGHRGMMDCDDYYEYGHPGMRGSGWMNWRNWWPWRDEKK